MENTVGRIKKLKNAEKFIIGRYFSEQGQMPVKVR